MTENNAGCCFGQSMQNNAPQPQKKSGGLYRNVKMSVRTANIVILVGILALFASIVFLTRHNGFTITFDTGGGSYVESCRVLHSETVTTPDAPVREGWKFDGWYLDRDCTVAWDIQSDTVTESMTLYAGWSPNT